MRPTDVLLVSVISGESALIVSLIGWSLRRAQTQLGTVSHELERLANAVNRHLAWHDGLDDRNAWRKQP